MKNICLILEYVGTNYCGFQRQKNGVTIQEILEEAILEVTGESCTTYPSGRTDAGVHAFGQVVNFFTSSNIPSSKFKIVLNQKLPSDIRVRESFEVQENFHSRKSAKSKTYIYKIYTGTQFSVFDSKRCLYCKYELDENKMNYASSLFVGTHDFSSFMASNSSVKSTIRTIFNAGFKRDGDYLIFEITGNGFLYNMVRIIVGTLIEVGRGKLTKEDVLELLKGNNRRMAGKTVSPDGLYLKEVKYY